MTKRKVHSNVESGAIGNNLHADENLFSTSEQSKYKRQTVSKVHSNVESGPIRNNLLPDIQNAQVAIISGKKKGTFKC